MAVGIRECRCPRARRHFTRFVDESAAAIQQLFVRCDDALYTDNDLDRSGQGPIRPVQARVQHQHDRSCKEECKRLELMLQNEARLVAIECDRRRQVTHSQSDQIDLHCGVSILLRVIADDLAGFHHELHALKFSDVGERITGNGDEVRELSFLD